MPDELRCTCCKRPIKGKPVMLAMVRTEGPLTGHADYDYTFVKPKEALDLGEPIIEMNEFGPGCARRILKYGS